MTWIFQVAMRGGARFSSPFAKGDRGGFIPVLVIRHRSNEILPDPPFLKEGVKTLQHVSGLKLKASGFIGLPQHPEAGEGYRN